MRRSSARASATISCGRSKRSELVDMTSTSQESRDGIGEEYGMTGRNIARYMRVDKLIPPFKDKLDAGEADLDGGGGAVLPVGRGTGNRGGGRA